MGGHSREEDTQNDQSIASVTKVDTDAEHDQKRAHRVSNAALNRIADSGPKKKDPVKAKALSEAAASKSYDSVQDGLQGLAKAMHTSGPYLADLMAMDDSERNNTNKVRLLGYVLRMVSADSTNLSLMLQGVPSPGTMSPDVSTVAGAWTACRHNFESAFTFYKDNGGTDVTDLSEVERSIKEMIKTVHGDPNNFREDRKEPTDDQDKLNNKAFEEQLAAANKSLDAIAAGSTDADQVLRATTRHIGVQGHYSKAFQTHHAGVVALQKRLNRMLQDEPKNAALSDALWSINGGLKQ